jgi:splicing factor 1
VDNVTTTEAAVGSASSASAVENVTTTEVAVESASSASAVENVTTTEVAVESASSASSATEVIELGADSVTSEQPCAEKTEKTETEKTETKQRKRKNRWGAVATSDEIASSSAAAGETKKKSRWGSKVDTPLNALAVQNALTLAPLAGLATTLAVSRAGTELATKLSALKEKALSIDETGGADRSPSPEPIYDSQGIRINTRQHRARKEIQEETHKLIQQAMSMNPLFMGVDRLVNRKYHKKIYLPQNKYPGVNFKGILIGVRGRNQKRLEAETGCSIAVRGKDMRKRKEGEPTEDDLDENHVLIIANSQEQLDAAEKKINDLLVPPPADHHEKMLVELAMANGTYISKDNIRCHICGETGHKIATCPNRQAASWKAANIMCLHCGDNSHISQDCPHMNAADPQASKRKLDSEYNEFMAELTGETPPPSKASDVKIPPKPMLPIGGHGGPRFPLGGHGGRAGFPAPPSGNVGRPSFSRPPFPMMGGMPMHGMGMNGMGMPGMGMPGMGMPGMGGMGMPGMGMGGMGMPGMGMPMGGGVPPWQMNRMGGMNMGGHGGNMYGGGGNPWQSANMRSQGFPSGAPGGSMFPPMQYQNNNRKNNSSVNSTSDSGSNPYLSNVPPPPGLANPLYHGGHG